MDIKEYINILAVCSKIWHYFFSHQWSISSPCHFALNFLSHKCAFSGAIEETLNCSKSGIVSNFYVLDNLQQYSLTNV